jgi:hypothetical protein
MKKKEGDSDSIRITLKNPNPNQKKSGHGGLPGAHLLSAAWRRFAVEREEDRASRGLNTADTEKLRHRAF